jgi:hypothetical protein
MSLLALSVLAFISCACGQLNLVFVFELRSSRWLEDPTFLSSVHPFAGNPARYRSDFISPFFASRTKFSSTCSTHPKRRKVGRQCIFIFPRGLRQAQRAHDAQRDGYWVPQRWAASIPEMALIESNE